MKVKNKKKTKVRKSTVLKRNTLYQYMGGGYDGCHFEWNYFIMKANGSFVDIYSTGRMAIKTKKDAIEYVSSKSRDYYTFDLTSKKKIAEFAHETNYNNVGRVADAVNTLLKKDILYFECSYCNEKVFPSRHCEYPSYFHDPENYCGNGGIGINQCAILCENCACNTCIKCGSIFCPNDKTFETSDGERVCEFCHKAN
jgi:hypothetical protein